MIPEANTNADEQQPGRQEPPPSPPPADQPPVPPPASPPYAIEARQEPLASASPPAPPGGGLAAGLRRMSPAGRWVLGLALAFLSGLAFLLLGTISSIAYGIALSIALVVAFALALPAGFVLGSWLAVVALAIATAAGGFVGSWARVQLFPTGGEIVTGMNAVLLLFVFFVVLDLAPFIGFLLAGVGIGKLQGIALGQPHALTARDVRATRWTAALALVIATGLLTPQLGNMPGMIGMQAQPGDDIFPGILYAIVLAAACLPAGWLLRSWWGGVAAPVAYVGIASLANLTFGAGAWAVGFALYIVLPAVVMSAIGTAIGMYTASRGNPTPRYGQPAT